MKRESDALQALGEELVKQSRVRLEKIEMPDRLRDAIFEAQRITAHGGKRRQLQLIGKLMRSVDVTPLKAAMDEIKGASAESIAHQKRLERLRTQVMEDESAFNQIARDYPHADIQHLRQLRRNAIKEAQQSKPPKAFRELFRQLRDAVEGLGQIDSSTLHSALDSTEL